MDDEIDPPYKLDFHRYRCYIVDCASWKIHVWKCHRWRHVVGAMAAVAPADDDTVPIEPGTVSKADQNKRLLQHLPDYIILFLMFFCFPGPILGPYTSSPNLKLEILCFCVFVFLCWQCS